MGGFIPRLRILTTPSLLYLAIGILGATVMPHNLFLHSAVVQTRNYARTPSGVPLSACLMESSVGKQGKLALLSLRNEVGLWMGSSAAIRVKGTDGMGCLPLEALGSKLLICKALKKSDFQGFFQGRRPRGVSNTLRPNLSWGRLGLHGVPGA